MVMSWSHTPQAYENARIRILCLDEETIRCIYAEWRANTPDGFNQAIFDRELRLAQDEDVYELAADIWDYAEQQRDCTNDFSRAYVCPFHCEAHTVSFDDPMTVCPECNGSGELEYTLPATAGLPEPLTTTGRCHRCEGWGEIEAEDLR